MTRATASQSSVSETALFIGTIEVEFLSTDIYILMHVWQTPVRGGWTVRLRVHVLSVCLDKRIDESVNKQRHRNFIENCMSLLNQMLTFSRAMLWISCFDSTRTFRKAEHDQNGALILGSLDGENGTNFKNWLSGIKARGDLKIRFTIILQIIYFQIKQKETLWRKQSLSNYITPQNV